jgi:hypothetical protein
MYPYNHKMGQKIQTDANGVSVDRAFLAHYQIAAADAVVASNVAIHADITLADGDTTEVITNITNPDIPRALRVKGNAAGIAGDVVIEGTNYNGDAITETIIAADAGIVEGAKAFKTVTKITVPARTAEGDKISVGFNEKLGLPYKLTHNTVIATYLDNVAEAAPTVVTDVDEIEKNTVDLVTALSGVVVDIYLLV